MSKAKYTPGPWTFHTQGTLGYPTTMSSEHAPKWRTINGREPNPEARVPICSFKHCDDADFGKQNEFLRDVNLANAQLIATAPDTLAMLEKMIVAFEYWNVHHTTHSGYGPEQLAEAKQVAAKARGES